MDRIMVIGCCGAGKSTLSRKLGEKLGLPIIHLDHEYWQAGWVETPKDQWNEKIVDLIQAPSFIMDGNYSGSLARRIEVATQLIFLDYPTRICFWRVIKRIIKNYGKTRSDMKAGCPERFDLEFLHYVLIFNITVRKKIYRIIDKTVHAAKVTILKNDKQVDTFLDQI